MSSLIPRPLKETVESEETFSLPETLRIDNEFEEDVLEAFLSRHHADEEEDAPFTIRIWKKDSLPEGGYRLHITKEEAVITAPESSGAVQGLTSLYLLNELGELSPMEIYDTPKYEHRGLNLDCARHFFKAEEVKKVIEEMSLVKMNVLHWHLSDDQGWRIECESFPKLNETGEYFTKEEIRDVVEYARVRGIDVIPEIDMPGHTSAILSAYPEYNCTGEEVSVKKSGGIFPVILCPGKEETFDFLKTLLHEVSELFPSKYFHIGGDEAPKNRWMECEDCKKVMEENGLSTYEDLQGWFTKKVADILKEEGKKIICWNDMLETEVLPEEKLIQYWTLNHAESMERYVKAGGKYIYSDMFELYFDYPHSMIPLRRLYLSNPLINNTAYEEGMKGIECCLWTEHISDPSALEQKLFPRLQAVAEKGWSKEKDAYLNFERRLKDYIELVRHDVSYTPIEHWDPSGKARRKETMSFMSQMNEGMDKDTLKETVAASAPGKEFAKAFMTKFFSPLDLPFILPTLMKK